MVRGSLSERDFSSPFCCSHWEAPILAGIGVFQFSGVISITDKIKTNKRRFMREGTTTPRPPIGGCCDKAPTPVSGLSLLEQRTVRTLPAPGCDRGLPGGGHFSFRGIWFITGWEFEAENRSLCRSISRNSFAVRTEVEISRLCAWHKNSQKLPRQLWCWFRTSGR